MDDKIHEVSFSPTLIGREKEFDDLQSLWEEIKGGTGHTVFISGEAGIGKTRLVNELIQKAQEDVTVIKGWCLADAFEPLMPFNEGFREVGLSHLISESPPPKVISAYLMDDSGLMITEAERDMSGLDPDIFASMLSAVGNFVTDSLSMMGNKQTGGLNTLSYGKHSIIIQTDGNLSLATIIEGESSELLIEDMKSVLKEIGKELKDWDGSENAAMEVAPKIRWFIDSKKYSGVHLVDNPKIKQENLFENVLLGLRRISSEKPLIIFLDDMHWADNSSLKLFHYISRNTRNNKILILGTYRPEDVIQSEEGIHPLKTLMQNMSRESLLHEIPVGRLDSPAIETLIKNILEDVELKEEFINNIYTESEGNPFFTLEVIKMLIEERHLKRVDGNWEVNQNLEDINIPSKVYDIVSRRVDRLILEHRELLECASVVGEEFESGVIGNIMDINRVSLLKNLNVIERNHNLIHAINLKYRFDHRKIREVLYNGIIEELREEFHKMIAEAYESIKDEGRQDLIFELAKHWDKGGVYDKAYEYYEQAAKIAKDSYANKQAIEFYNRLLEIIPKLDTLEDTEKKTIHYLHKKGDCLKTIGEWESAGDAYSKSIDISEDLGDKKLIADCKVKLGNLRLREARYDESLKLCKDSSSLYKELGDENKYCESLGNIGSVYNSISEYDKAMEFLTEMQKIAIRLHDSNLMSQLYGNMGSTHYGRGELDESLEFYNKKLKIEEEEEDLLEIGYTRVNMASIYVRLQEYDKCMDMCHRVLEIAKKTGDKLMEQNALGKLGISYAEQGDYSKGLEYYTKKLNLAEKMGDRRSAGYVANNIGELYKEKGEYERALEYFEKDMKISKEVGDKKGYSITVGNMGNLYKLMGEYEKAEELYDETIAIGREHDIKDVLSYFLSDKADLCFKQNLIQEAKKLNDEAIALAERINMSETLFLAHLLEAKLISETDKNRGIDILDGMLDDELTDPEKAKLLYELYQMSGDDKYKKDALEFYTKLYEKNPSKHYQDIIEEMED